MRVSIDSREWARVEQRLPTEIPVPALGRSGYSFKRQITEAQAGRLRNYPDDWVQIRIGGYLVLRSIFGELRKEIHSDVIATIDRDERISRAVG